MGKNQTGSTTYRKGYSKLLYWFPCTGYLFFTYAKVVLQFLPKCCTDGISMSWLWYDTGSGTYFEGKIRSRMEVTSLFLCMVDLWCCVLHQKIYPSKGMQKYTEIFADNCMWNGCVLCLPHGLSFSRRSTYDILLWKCTLSCSDVI